ncbi:MAG TPA: hypothetical protein VFJ74_03670 [Gemmatimonadaceae bacterium]|nr:hypothetical protein [Gemmatimonadaceae bacterium]
MRPLRFLRWPTYFIASLLIFVPLFDLIITIWPIQGSNLRWRVATMGQVSASEVLAILGLLLLLIASVIFDQPRVQRVVAALAGLMAAVLLVLVPLFLLDITQLRPDVRPELKHPFDLVATQSTLKLILEIIAYASLALAGFRASRATVEQTAPKRGGRADVLVGGVRGTEKGAATAP